MRMREGAIGNLPTSGGEPWVCELVLRRTGPEGLTLPRSAEHVLMTATIDAETVGKLGGPGAIPRALEADRRRFVQAAKVGGYGAPWVVELDVYRGRRPRSFVIGELVRA